MIFFVIYQLILLRSKNQRKKQALRPEHELLGIAYHEYWNMKQIMLSLCLLVFMAVKEKTNKQTRIGNYLWPHINLLTVSSSWGFYLPSPYGARSFKVLGSVNLLATSLLLEFSLRWNLSFCFGLFQEDPGHPHTIHGLYNQMEASRCAA